MPVRRRLSSCSSSSSGPSGVSSSRELSVSAGSMDHPVCFRADKSKRSQTTEEGPMRSSVVSLKSAGSMDHPVCFRVDKSKRSLQSTDSSLGLSRLSLSSNIHMERPLRAGNHPSTRSQTTEEGPMRSSGVSLKSAGSMDHPVCFRADKSKRSQTTEEGPMRSSGVSLKSAGSMDHPVCFRADKSKRSRKRKQSKQSLSSPSASSALSTEHPLCFSENIKIRRLESSSGSGGVSTRNRQHRQDTEDYREYVLKVTKVHKEAMKKRVTYTSEGTDDQRTTFNRIYSQLIITTGESEGPHEEHTFRNMKKYEMGGHSTVTLADIFKPLPVQSESRRRVLTKGVAGIGKSFTVQKFILDWAEDKTNQDTEFIFSFAFRELNLSTGDKSLYDLLAEFHPELKKWTISENFFKTKIIVILDGLDESRFQLDFDDKTITSVFDITSVSNLIANLIKGDLLPDAKLWITSRPAAASQIPAEYIDMVTEIRGFSDPQKEEYFRKRFSHDLDLAERIISHVRTSHSLDIMCQIPIFCWICALLFQETFSGEETAKIPQTLTEMMAHFLLAQTKRRNRKYEAQSEGDEEGLLKTHKEFLLKLGKLAFVQLQKNNLIFYDEDLEDHGIDIKEASIYSGFCSTIFIEERVISQKKVFSFVHLTIQEFFAALFVYDCLTNKNTKELKGFLSLGVEEYTLLDLLKMIVDKVLEKENGHLDFFLRFSLGLMVEPNRRVLHGLLTSVDPSQETVKKILIYLKAIRRKNLSPDGSISLFQAMVEMRDHKVKDEIEEYLKCPGCSKAELTPMHCSALAFMLLVSKNDLEELNLKRYSASDEGRRRLIPAVRSSKKAVLAYCRVTEEWVEHLAFGLKFPYLPLRDLDLSNNDLTDSGVKRLCVALASPTCRLRILRLSGCLVSGVGCFYLAEALDSNPSQLTELDLSYNNPEGLGLKLISEQKEDNKNALIELNVDWGGVHRMKPGLKKYAYNLTFDPCTAHRNLLLSEGNRKVSWVKETQNYPNHQERFDHFPQVLASQSLKGRYYWEMEVVEPFSIGATHKTIGRKGVKDDGKLGRNDKSWCLTCSDDGWFVWHDNKSVNVASHSSRFSRVGVYLDSAAGTLSFYRVSSNSQTRLHTFEDISSDPLYPAVALDTFSSALFCQPG